MATPNSLASGPPPRVNRRPELPPTVIVIGEEGTFGPWGPDPVPDVPSSIGHLGEVLGHLGPRPTAVVHEGAFDRLGITGKTPNKHDPPRAGLFADVGSYRTPIAVDEWAWSRWRGADGRDFHLIVPGWGRGPFTGLGSSRELVGALGAWYTATGETEWHGWGTMTSDAMLRRTAKRTGVPEPLGAGHVRELPMEWSRAPAADEHHYRWLHALDVNGQHLAVAGSLPLPAGDAELVDWPTFDKTVPGLWHVELPPWTDPRFPPPWPTDLAGDGALWVTTPTMERIVQELGAEAMEAYVWPTHGRYLRGWQETLRDARSWLLETGQWKGPAGAAVKDVYQSGPGRLYSPKRSASPAELDPLYQPYWYLAIVAEARCRLHRRVRALPVRPVAVYKDALYFLSSRPTPERLAEVLGLPLGDRLGAFKPAGTIPARDARALLTSGRFGPSATAGVIAKMVRDHGK